MQVSDTSAKPAADNNEMVRDNASQLRQSRMSSLGMPTEKSKNFGVTTRRLGLMLGRDMWRIGFISFLAVASVILVVLGPRILGHATNIVFDGLMGRNGGGGIDFDALHRTLFVALGVYLGSYVLAYGQAFLLAGVVQKSMHRLRLDVEGKIHRLPLDYIDRNSRGDLLSRVTNDIDNMAQSLQQSLSQLLTAILTIVGVLVMMFTVSWQLALIALVMIPTSLVSMRVIAARSRRAFIAQWRNTGALNGVIEETFTGHAIVKAFGRQQAVEAQFDEFNQNLHRAGFWAQFMSGSIQPVMMFIGNLNYVAIAVVGGLRVAHGQMGLGDVQAFIQYSRQFTNPLSQAASMFNVLQSGVASAERVFELLDADEERTDPTAQAAVPIEGRVEFEHVGFAYSADRPLISDLSFVAEPGDTIAIVGPTGAGKTTIVNLVMRFYELNSGRITIDGRDVTSMPRAELRSAFGMVLQDTWLFNGTIRENIAYGNPSATEDQILQAAKAAYVDRFVHSLPDGYDTVLDGEGQAVSAGEKQLLTIARAFLADPSILILDEATSSVDTRTEVLIQRAMRRLRERRTSFVIAHRLSTIRDATTILVMENGSIVEQGSHDDLMAAKGAYFRLYESQFRAAITE